MGSTAAIGGHPFHPMLVAFPIAFLVMVPVLDVVYLRIRDDFWARMSYFVLLIGAAGALIAAIPGLIDYFTVPMVSEARWHFGAGISLIVFSLLHLWARKPAAPGATPRVLFPLGVIGVLLVMAQGYLGGDMVYKKHVAISPLSAASRAGSGGGQRKATGPSRVSPSGSNADGEALFVKNCSGCHGVNGSGGDQGPELSHEGSKHDASWIVAQTRDPASHNSNAQMPPIQLSDQNRPHIAAYVASLK